MSGSEAMHWLELSKVSMGQSMQQLHVGCWQGTGFQNLSIWLALVTTSHLDGFEEFHIIRAHKRSYKSDRGGDRGDSANW